MFVCFSSVSRWQGLRKFFEGISQQLVSRSWPAPPLCGLNSSSSSSSSEPLRSPSHDCLHKPTTFASNFLSRRQSFPTSNLRLLQSTSVPVAICWGQADGGDGEVGEPAVLFFLFVRWSSRRPRFVSCAVAAQPLSMSHPPTVNGHGSWDPGIPWRLQSLSQWERAPQLWEPKLSGDDSTACGACGVDRWYTTTKFENSVVPHWFFWGSLFSLFQVIVEPFCNFWEGSFLGPSSFLEVVSSPAISSTSLFIWFNLRSISWSNHMIYGYPDLNRVLNCKRVTFCLLQELQEFQSFDIDGQSVISPIGLWRWPTSRSERYFKNNPSNRYLSIIGAPPAETAKSAAKKLSARKQSFFSSFIVPSSKSSPASFDVKQNGSQLLVQCSDVTETEIHVKVRELRKPSNRKFIGSGYKVYILEV